MGAAEACTTNIVFGTGLKPPRSHGRNASEASI